MTAQPKQAMTEAEYIAYELTSTRKHEYYRGEVYAMAGGTEFHNLVAGNTYAALHVQLRRRPCRVYNSDQRLKIVSTGLYTYPDLTIVCGETQFLEPSRLTLINPTVLIEVLSASTERYDRGMKFQHYRTIVSLQEYVLIAQDEHRIEHYSRQAGGLWVLHEALGLAAMLELGSINCTLSLADVYEKVDVAEGAGAWPREVDET